MSVTTPTVTAPAEVQNDKKDGPAGDAKVAATDIDDKQSASLVLFSCKTHLLTMNTETSTGWNGPSNTVIVFSTLTLSLSIGLIFRFHWQTPVLRAY